MSEFLTDTPNDLTDHLHAPIRRKHTKISNTRCSLDNSKPPSVMDELKAFYFNNETDFLHILGSMQLLDIGPFHTIMWTTLGCDSRIRSNIEKATTRDIFSYQTRNARNIINSCRGTILYEDKDSIVSSFLHSLDSITAAKIIHQDLYHFNATVKTIRNGICVKTGIHKDDTNWHNRHSLEHIILKVKTIMDEAGPYEMCISETITDEIKNMIILQNSFYLYPKQKIIMTHTRETHTIRRMILQTEQ